MTFSGGGGLISQTVDIIFRAKDLTQAGFNSLGSKITSAKKIVGSFAQEVIKAGGGGASVTPKGVRYQDPTTGRFVKAGTPGAVEVPFGGKSSDQLGISVSRLAIAQKVVDLAVNAFTSAFQTLGTAISDGVNQQQQNVSAQLGFTKTLGLTQAQSASFVQDFNLQAARLGQALPISARDVSAFAQVIQTDFSNAITQAGGSAQQFKTVLLDVSSKIALSAQSANVDQGTAKAAVSAYLAGSVGVAGLNQYSFFANNPLLKQGLVQGLQQIKPGADSFGDLSAFQRVKLLTDTLNKTITKEDISQLQGTTAAKLASFTDTLFDPQIGLFSIQRDLDPKLPGYQSVFSSFEKTIDLLIGDKGIFGEVSRLLGGGTDPMVVLKSGVDQFNVFLGGFRDAIANLKTFDSATIGAAIGKFGAQVVNSVVGGVLTGIDSINYGAIAVGLGSGLVSFFANLNWKVYLTAGLVTVGLALIPPLLGAIAAGVGTIAAGIVAVVGGIPLAIGAAITLGIIAITKLISSNWDTIYTNVVRWGNTINDGISGFFNSISSAITGFTDWVGKLLGQINPVTAVTGVSQSVASVAANVLGARYRGQVGTASTGLLGAIATEAANAPTGAGLVIANTSETILTPEQLTALVGNSYGAGAASAPPTVTFQPGAIQVNLAQGTPNDIAMAAINIIESALLDSLENTLA